MTRILFIVLLFISQLAIAQEAALVYDGLRGECSPRHLSKSNTLNLYKLPDKRSLLKSVSYGTGWYIPHRGSEGITRVISTGKIQAKKRVELMWCTPSLPAEEPMVDSGEIVDYLFYTGEGYGLVLYKGSQCHAPIDEGFGKFDFLSHPEVQIWLKVLYKDGSSPGWLLNDGSQTTIGDVDC